MCTRTSGFISLLIVGEPVAKSYPVASIYLILCLKREGRWKENSEKRNVLLNYTVDCLSYTKWSTWQVAYSAHSSALTHMQLLLCDIQVPHFRLATVRLMGCNTRRYCFEEQLSISTHSDYHRLKDYWLIYHPFASEALVLVVHSTALSLVSCNITYF